MNTIKEVDIGYSTCDSAKSDSVDRPPLVPFHDDFQYIKLEHHSGVDRFIEDPKTVVEVGQIVKVRMVEFNKQLEWIALSMR